MVSEIQNECVNLVKKESMTEKWRADVCDQLCINFTCAHVSVCMCTHSCGESMLGPAPARAGQGNGSSFTSVGLGRSIQALGPDLLQLFWAGIESLPGLCSTLGLSSLNHCEIMFVKICSSHWVHILRQLGTLQCDSKACKGMSRCFEVFESRHCCPCRYSLLFS